jgi:Dolichyl-phosphate-mannose-protein mannosyltransferase
VRGGVASETTPRLSPAGALAGVVVLTAVLYAGIASLVDTPRIFYDELIYLEAAASFAEGDGLLVRGGAYAYGPLYPIVIAPLFALASDREAAYGLVKLLNALLFALTAVPVYLLARRLLEPWPSVGVAALSVLVPSSVYVTVVMTESLAYLVFSVALLAVVLALEWPSAWRQLAALALIGLAIVARAQFVLLYAAFLASLVLAHVLLPQRRALGWRGLSGLWPAGASVLAGLALFVVAPVVRGEDPEEALGGYEGLVQSYNPFSVAKWLVWHASGAELFLAVAAVAVAPVVLAALYRAARAGEEREAAFVTAFATVNAAALLVTAVVVTSQSAPGYDVDRLHDRYLFYVFPLWLVVLVWWLRASAPRPRTALRIGLVLALLLAIAFPYGRLDLENGVLLFSAAGTALPSAIEELAGSTVAGAVVTVLFVAALLAAVARGRAGGRLAIGVLVAVFLLNAVLVWGRAFNPPEREVFDGTALERRWVDERVPEGATVTVLDSSCEDAPLQRDSFFLTEFFNGSIEDVVAFGGDAPRARIEADGVVVLEDGTPLEAEYVVAQPRVQLDGRELGSGTSTGLVLWEVGEPVRVVVRPVGSSVPEGFCLPGSS